jgi:hypothetical protein
MRSVRTSSGAGACWRKVQKERTLAHLFMIALRPSSTRGFEALIGSLATDLHSIAVLYKCGVLYGALYTSL